MTVNRWSAKDSTISAGYAEAVTPSDVTVFDSPTRGLYVGTAGDVVVLMEDGTSPTTFVGVVAGSVLPIRCTQVRAATTASNIVALF